MAEHLAEAPNLLSEGYGTLTLLKAEQPLTC